MNSQNIQLNLNNVLMLALLQKISCLLPDKQPQQPAYNQTPSQAHRNPDLQKYSNKPAVYEYHHGHIKRLNQSENNHGHTNKPNQSELKHRKRELYQINPNNDNSSNIVKNGKNQCNRESHKNAKNRSNDENFKNIKNQSYNESQKNS